MTGSDNRSCRASVVPAPNRDTLLAVADCFSLLGPAGAANEVIGAVREKFDTAAHALVECATLVDPNVDPVQFLEHADDKASYAWQAIKPNIDTVTRIAALVTQFGCKSLTFSLIELPVQVGGTGFLDARALMCVDPKYSIEQSSAAFGRTGNHPGLSRRRRCSST